MLAGLHPGSRWRESTLEIPVAREAEYRPEGGGVLLLPSAQWTGEPLCGPMPDGSLLLLYPALTPLPYLPEDTPAPGADPDEPVAALLGRTRSAGPGPLTAGRSAAATRRTPSGSAAPAGSPTAPRSRASRTSSATVRTACASA